MIIQAREQLRDFLEESGKSQKQIGKEIGLSSAVISQFLAGIYTGDNDEIAVKVLRYLEVGKSRLNAIEPPPFCPDMHNTGMVLFACEYAHRNNKISMVYGAAGAGKTTALKYYAANNPGVVYVAANACTRGTRAILCMIAEVLGKDAGGSIFLIMRDLVKILRDSNRLIIVDEADHLTLTALQAVRNLYDEAGTGIVFSGNERIKTQMHGRGSSPFAQLDSRVSCRKCVDNKYKAKELNGLFGQLPDDCREHLLTVARRESLRTAVERYMFAAQFAAAQNRPLSLGYLIKCEMLQLE